MMCQKPVFAIFAMMGLVLLEIRVVKNKSRFF